MISSLLKGLGISGIGALSVVLIEAVAPSFIAKLDPATGAVVGAVVANVVNFLKLKFIDKK